MRNADKLTCLMIDGNSLVVVAGSRTTRGVIIHAVEHIEFESLVEVVRKLRHPIFMDVNLCWYSDKPRIESALKKLFQRPEFQNPVIVLLSPEKLRYDRETGPDTDQGRVRRHESLLRRHLSPNPFDYPALFFFEECAGSLGESASDLAIIRLSDLVPVFEILRGLKLEVLGALPCRHAAARALDMLHPATGDESPVILCEIGKLRTLYTTRINGNYFSHNVIPVGLARDDHHYFQSIPPSIDALISLEREIGRLLLPPEARITFGSEDRTTSPQIDATRFALQVSRYGERTIEALRVRQDHPRVEDSMVVHISGRASRLPGLLDFLRARIHADVKSISGGGHHGVTLPVSHQADLLTDNLLPIGALSAVLSVDASPPPLITTDFQIVPLKNDRMMVSLLESGKFYVLEQKPA